MGFSELNNVDANTKRLWAGYGKLARKQGTLTRVHRPTNPQNPISGTIATVPVIFTNSFGFAKPDRYGVSWLFAIFDATQARRGDYLVDCKTGDTYFIASLDLNNPILVVRCPRTISVSRANGPAGSKGVLGYSGAVKSEETILLANCKASILEGTKGDRNEAHLPMDVRMPWWTVLMPEIAGVMIDTGDIVRCDMGRKYAVSSAELTEKGWRLTVAYERV